MTHGRSWDIEIMTTLGLKCHTRAAPSCDIFNLGSSYFHVPLIAVRHLLNVHCSHVLLWLCLVHSAVTIYNAALNRPAYQSSVYGDFRGNFRAHLANDGNFDTNASSGGVPTCVNSNRDTNPWWAVDLGRPTAVYRVALTNRGDCCGTKKYMLVSRNRTFTRSNRRHNRSLRSAATIASCKHPIIVLCYVTAVLVF